MSKTASETVEQPIAIIGIGSTGLPMREKVLRLEQELLRGETIDLPVNHHFAQGLYARELFIPKGTVLTGKIHRFEQINIISQGEISVLTEDGIVRIKAPYTLVSPPGTKRVGYAHEDTVWTTIHPNPGDETDLEALEARLIAPCFDVLETDEEALQLKEK
jgi:hypothetical protein